MCAHYVIIGAGQAGRRTAESLRERDSQSRISLIGEEEHIPYDRPVLSKEGLIDEDSLQSAFVVDKNFYSDQNIHLLLGSPVVSVTPNEKKILLGNDDVIQYDKLIFATGSRVRKLITKGAENANIHYVRTLNDSKQLSQAARGKSHVVIIGGGFIGLEVAATLTTHFKMDVTLLESGERILKRVMPSALSDYMHQLHQEKGINILLNSSLTQIHTHADNTYTLETNHGAIHTELIVAGIGVHPNQELAAAAGIHVNNGIVVDEHGRTNIPDIYAAGDVTAHFNPFYQAHIRLESWQVAENQPVAIANHICGLSSEGFNDIPWLWSDQYTHNLQMLGDFCFASQLVIRQEAKSEHFALIGLNDQQQIKAVCAVNQGRDISMYRRLMQSNCSVAPALLTDSNTPLRSLQSLLRN